MRFLRHWFVWIAFTYTYIGTVSLECICSSYIGTGFSDKYPLLGDSEEDSPFVNNMYIHMMHVIDDISIYKGIFPFIEMEIVSCKLSGRDILLNTNDIKTFDVSNIIGIKKKAAEYMFKCYLSLDVGCLYNAPDKPQVQIGSGATLAYMLLDNKHALMINIHGMCPISNTNMQLDNIRGDESGFYKQVLNKVDSVVVSELVTYYNNAISIEPNVSASIEWVTMAGIRWAVGGSIFWSKYTDSERRFFTTLFSKIKLHICDFVSVEIGVSLDARRSIILDASMMFSLSHLAMDFFNADSYYEDSLEELSDIDAESTEKEIHQDSLIDLLVHDFTERECIIRWNIDHLSESSKSTIWNKETNEPQRFVEIEVASDWDTAISLLGPHDILWIKKDLVLPKNAALFKNKDITIMGCKDVEDGYGNVFKIGKQCNLYLSNSIGWDPAVQAESMSINSYGVIIHAPKEKLDVPLFRTPKSNNVDDQHPNDVDIIQLDSSDPPGLFNKKINLYDGALIFNKHNTILDMEETLLNINEDFSLQSEDGIIPIYIKQANQIAYVNLFGKTIGILYNSYTKDNTSQTLAQSIIDTCDIILIYGEVLMDKSIVVTKSLSLGSVNSIIRNHKFEIHNIDGAKIDNHILLLDSLSNFHIYSGGVLDIEDLEVNYVDSSLSAYPLIYVEPPEKGAPVATYVPPSVNIKNTSFGFPVCIIQANNLPANININHQHVDLVSGIKNKDLEDETWIVVGDILCENMLSITGNVSVLGGQKEYILNTKQQDHHYGLQSILLTELQNKIYNINGTSGLFKLKGKASLVVDKVNIMGVGGDLVDTTLSDTSGYYVDLRKTNIFSTFTLKMIHNGKILLKDHNVLKLSGNSNENWMKFITENKANSTIIINGYVYMESEITFPSGYKHNLFGGKSSYFDFEDPNGNVYTIKIVSEGNGVIESIAEYCFNISSNTQLCISQTSIRFRNKFVLVNQNLDNVQPAIVDLTDIYTVFNKKDLYIDAKTDLVLLLPNGYSLGPLLDKDNSFQYRFIANTVFVKDRIEINKDVCISKSFVGEHAIDTGYYKFHIENPSIIGPVQIMFSDKGHFYVSKDNVAMQLTDIRLVSEVIAPLFQSQKNVYSGVIDLVHASFEVPGIEIIWHSGTFLFENKTLHFIQHNSKMPSTCNNSIILLGESVEVNHIVSSYGENIISGARSKDVNIVTQNRNLNLSLKFIEDHASGAWPEIKNFAICMHDNSSMTLERVSLHVNGWHDRLIYPDPDETVVHYIVDASNCVFNEDVNIIASETTTIFLPGGKVFDHIQHDLLVDDTDQTVMLNGLLEKKATKFILRQELNITSPIHVVNDLEILPVGIPSARTLEFVDNDINHTLRTLSVHNVSLEDIKEDSSLVIKGSAPYFVVYDNARLVIGANIVVEVPEDEPMIWLAENAKTFCIDISASKLLNDGKLLLVNCLSTHPSGKIKFADKEVLLCSSIIDLEISAHKDRIMYVYGTTEINNKQIIDADQHVTFVPHDFIVSVKDSAQQTFKFGLISNQLISDPIIYLNIPEKDPAFVCTGGAKLSFLASLDNRKIIIASDSSNKTLLSVEKSEYNSKMVHIDFKSCKLSDYDQPWICNIFTNAKISFEDGYEVVAVDDHTLFSLASGSKTNILLCVDNIKISDPTNIIDLSDHHIIICGEYNIVSKSQNIMLYGMSGATLESAARYNRNALFEIVSDNTTVEFFNVTLKPGLKAPIVKIGDMAHNTTLKINKVMVPKYPSIEMRGLFAVLHIEGTTINLCEPDNIIDFYGDNIAWCWTGEKNIYNNPMMVSGSHIYLGNLPRVQAHSVFYNGGTGDHEDVYNIYGNIDIYQAKFSIHTENTTVLYVVDHTSLHIDNLAIIMDKILSEPDANGYIFISIRAGVELDIRFLENISPQTISFYPAHNSSIRATIVPNILLSSKDSTLKEIDLLLLGSGLVDNIDKNTYLIPTGQSGVTIQGLKIHKNCWLKCICDGSMVDIFDLKFHLLNMPVETTFEVLSHNKQDHIYNDRYVDIWLSEDSNIEIQGAIKIMSPQDIFIYGASGITISFGEQATSDSVIRFMWDYEAINPMAIHKGYASVYMVNDSAIQLYNVPYGKKTTYFIWRDILLKPEADIYGELNLKLAVDGSVIMLKQESGIDMVVSSALSSSAAVLLGNSIPIKLFPGSVCNIDQLLIDSSTDADNVDKVLCAFDIQDVMEPKAELYMTNVLHNNPIQIAWLNKQCNGFINLNGIKIVVIGSGNVEEVLAMIQHNDNILLIDSISLPYLMVSHDLCISSNLSMGGVKLIPSFVHSSENIKLVFDNTTDTSHIYIDGPYSFSMQSVPVLVSNSKGELYIDVEYKASSGIVNIDIFDLKNHFETFSCGNVRDVIVTLSPDTVVVFEQIKGTGVLGRHYKTEYLLQDLMSAVGYPEYKHVSFYASSIDSRFNKTTILAFSKSFIDSEDKEVFNGYRSVYTNLEYWESNATLDLKLSIRSSMESKSDEVSTKVYMKTPLVISEFDLKDAIEISMFGIHMSLYPDCVQLCDVKNVDLLWHQGFVEHPWGVLTQDLHGQDIEISMTLDNANCIFWTDESVCLVIAKPMKQSQFISYTFFRPKTVIVSGITGATEASTYLWEELKWKINIKNFSGYISMPDQWLDMSKIDAMGNLDRLDDTTYFNWKAHGLLGAQKGSGNYRIEWIGEFNIRYPNISTEYLENIKYIKLVEQFGPSSLIHVLVNKASFVLENQYREWQFIVQISEFQYDKGNLLTPHNSCILQGQSNTVAMVSDSQGLSTFLNTMQQENTVYLIGEEIDLMETIVIKDGVTLRIASICEMYDIWESLHVSGISDVINFKFDPYLFYIDQKFGPSVIHPKHEGYLFDVMSGGRLCISGGSNIVFDVSQDFLFIRSLYSSLYDLPYTWIIFPRGIMKMKGYVGHINIDRANTIVIDSESAQYIQYLTEGPYEFMRDPIRNIGVVDFDKQGVNNRRTGYINIDPYNTSGVSSELELSYGHNYVLFMSDVLIKSTKGDRCLVHMGTDYIEETTRQKHGNSNIKIIGHDISKGGSLWKTIDDYGYVPYINIYLQDRTVDHTACNVVIDVIPTEDMIYTPKSVNGKFYPAKLHFNLMEESDQQNTLTVKFTQSPGNVVDCRIDVYDSLLDGGILTTWMLMESEAYREIAKSTELSKYIVCCNELVSFGHGGVLGRPQGIEPFIIHTANHPYYLGSNVQIEHQGKHNLLNMTFSCEYDVNENLYILDSDRTLPLIKVVASNTYVNPIQICYVGKFSVLIEQDQGILSLGKQHLISIDDISVPVNLDISKSTRTVYKVPADIIHNIAFVNEDIDIVIGISGLLDGQLLLPGNKTVVVTSANRLSLPGNKLPDYLVLNNMVDVYDTLIVDKPCTITGDYSLHQYDLWGLAYIRDAKGRVNVGPSVSGKKIMNFYKKGGYTVGDGSLDESLPLQDLRPLPAHVLRSHNGLVLDLFVASNGLPKKVGLRTHGPAFVLNAQSTSLNIARVCLELGNTGQIHQYCNMKNMAYTDAKLCPWVRSKHPFCYVVFRDILYVSGDTMLTSLLGLDSHVFWIISQKHFFSGSVTSSVFVPQDPDFNEYLFNYVIIDMFLDYSSACLASRVLSPKYDSATVHPYDSTVGTMMLFQQHYIKENYSWVSSLFPQEVPWKHASLHTITNSDCTEPVGEEARKEYIDHVFNLKHGVVMPIGESYLNILHTNPDITDLKDLISNKEATMNEDVAYKADVWLYNAGMMPSLGFVGYRPYTVSGKITYVGLTEHSTWNTQYIYNYKDTQATNGKYTDGFNFTDGTLSVSGDVFEPPQLAGGFELNGKDFLKAGCYFWMNKKHINVENPIAWKPVTDSMTITDIVAPHSFFDSSSSEYANATMKFKKEFNHDAIIYQTNYKLFYPSASIIEDMKAQILAIGD